MPAEVIEDDDDNDEKMDSATMQDQPSETFSEQAHNSSESGPPTTVPATAALKQVNPLNALLIAAADLGDAQSQSSAKQTEAPPTVQPPQSGGGSSDFLHEASTSGAMSGVVSREASTSWSYSATTRALKFEDIDEDMEQRRYEHQLYRDRLSTLLYSADAPVDRHSVKLESLIADIESLGFTVSGKQSVGSKPIVLERVMGEMGIEQWLQVSGEPGQEVAVFSMDDLRRLVSNSIRQKIPSLGANLFVNLRFEEVRKYSSVQVRDPRGVLYVPPPTAPPAMAVA